MTTIKKEHQLNNKKSNLNSAKRERSLLYNEMLKDTAKQLNQVFSQEPTLSNLTRIRLLWQKLINLLIYLEQPLSVSEENKESDSDSEETTRQIFRLSLNFLTYFKKAMEFTKGLKENEKYLKDFLEEYAALIQGIIKIIDHLKLRNKRTLSNKMFSLLEELECLVDDCLFFLLFFSFILSPSPIFALLLSEKSFNLLANWVVNPDPLKNGREQRKNLFENVFTNHPLNITLQHTINRDNSYKHAINWAILFSPKNVIKNIPLSPSEAPQPIQEDKPTFYPQR